MKKRIIIIGVILLSICLVTTLIGTLATDSAVATTDNTHTITLTGSTGEITVPASTSKTVLYQITNTNKGIVKYGVAYSGDNITVKVYNDTIDEVTGTIDYGENKFIKLYIENTGDTDSIASIKTVLGYEYGGELESIVPTGYTLVTEEYAIPKGTNLITHLTNLYLSNKDADLVENNGISYGYASSVGLMNDRQGTMDVGEDEGNIRYYGADPNNYIYFNCEDYSDQSADTCETWRIIGIVDGKVKIINPISIGGLSWDYDYNNEEPTESWSNNWETSSLQTLLNGAYYNNLDTIYYNWYGSGGSNNSYENEKNTVVSILPYNSVNSKTTTTIANTSVQLNFNTNGTGLTETTRKLISPSTWYLGGYSSVSSLYANDVYTYERTNSTSTIYGDNPFSIERNIGLMYASDYSYAADLDVCTKTINYYYSDTTNCTGTDWLVSNTNYWLITPTSGYSYAAWYVYSSGNVDAGYVYRNTLGVHPVLYLESKLAIESESTGTSSDPYRISVS